MQRARREGVLPGADNPKAEDGVTSGVDSIMTSRGIRFRQVNFGFGDNPAGGAGLSSFVK